MVQERSQRTESAGSTKSKYQSIVIFFVILSTTFVPCILAIWLLSLSVRTHFGGIQVISPTRWIFSTGVPIFLACRGLLKNSLSLSGAIAALFVGFLLTIANYSFSLCMIVFFLTSSKLTKFKASKKKEQEEEYKVGGSRNWIQVLCNGGFPSAMAVLYLIDHGSGEIAIDFQKQGSTIGSWLSAAVLGSIACACGDTWASEIGSVMGNGSAVLVTTGKNVRAGTNGGVTVVGTIASGLGGAVIGLTYFITTHLTCTVNSYQWPLIITGLLSGLIGSLIDSVFGATLQYSGFNEITKKVVNEPGPDVKWISGMNFLDNHAVNSVTCCIMGLTIPFMHKLVVFISTSLVTAITS